MHDGHFSQKPEVRTCPEVDSGPFSSIPAITMHNTAYCTFMICIHQLH